MKLNKITSKLPMDVQAQACKGECWETVWSGRTEAEGFEEGCWSTEAQTARGAWW